MKQTQEQLHNELMDKLSEFTDDLGYIYHQIRYLIPLNL